MYVIFIFTNCTKEPIEAFDISLSHSHCVKCIQLRINAMLLIAIESLKLRILKI